MAFSDSFLRGVQTRLGLEQLAEAQEERESKAKIKKAAADAMESAPMMGTSEEGMNLNMGGSQEKTFNPEKYIENLRAAGQPELAMKFENTYRKHTEEKQAMEIGDVLQAFDLAEAGDKVKAMEIANRHMPKGSKLIDVNITVDSKSGKKTATLKTNMGEQVVDVETYRKAAVDAKSEWEKKTAFDQSVALNQYDAPVYDPVHQIITQRSKVGGETKLIANLAKEKRDKEKDLSPYERKQQELAATKYIDSMEDDKKLATRLDHISDATSSFVDYYKNSKAGTGLASMLTPNWASTAQQGVDRKFKALNLQEMVATFQGMSRAVDSDAERKMFEQKQPSVSNDDSVNAQILVGSQAMAVKQKAENAAVREYIAANQTLDKYESPVIGKKTVMFDSTGTPVLVDKDSIANLKKSGFRSTDEQAYFILHGTLPPDLSPESLVIDNWKFPNKKARDKYLKDKGSK